MNEVCVVSGARGVEAPYAVVVWAGAEHEWGSGNALDAAVLAARTHLLVLTLNYRIGLLGNRTLTYPTICSSEIQSFVIVNSRSARSILPGSYRTSR